MRVASKATGKSALFLFSVAALLAAGTLMVRGQSALDGFDPNANGTIRAVAVQADGKILIGGDFTTLQPNGAASATTRSYIARLNADGTLDTAFNAAANNSVYAIALQADGKILVGGDFSSTGGSNSIGGQPRNHIARLDPAAGSADSWDPNANARVASIVVQANGKILVGGLFNQSNGTPTIGGATRNRIVSLDQGTGLADSFDPNANNAVEVIAVQADGRILVGGDLTALSPNGGAAVTRNHIARLDAATGTPDSFNPNANSTVVAIALQADGKVLVGGDFTIFSPNGGAAVGRNNIARLNTDGTLDTFNPSPLGTVSAIALQPDGKILVGGAFTDIASQPRSRIARLDGATGFADSFNQNGTTNNPVFAIAVQADGKILAGGLFTTIGGATRNRIARLEIDGSLDQTLNINAVGTDVLATAVQRDGRVLIGGDFSNVLGAPRNNLARLNTDGTLDTTFFADASGSVYAIALQADGKILIGGAFTTILPNGASNPTARNHIARLNSDGTLDTAFDPSANSNVYSIVLQADGKILVGGDFNQAVGTPTIGGQTRNRIARLDASGAADPSFDPNASDIVFSIALQADGKILAGGLFTSIGGQARNFISRLDSASGLADSFNPNANNSVYSIAVQPDGEILVGGNFNAPAGTNSIGGQTRNRIARLDSTGAADSFDPNANGRVYAIALQADGKVLASGLFTSIGGAARNRIARLNATNGSADSFDPNANAEVDAITLQGDGKILAGGSFSGANSIGGQARNLFARLSNDTAALQNLAATQSTITWTRGGSSAQFARVTFESSTDNVNYSPVGNGTAAGSNWTLTGLSLPTNQNIYIRARGYYESGLGDGSESVTESVRNAFLPVLKILSLTRLTSGHVILQCLGVPNRVNDLQVSPDLSPNSFGAISPLPAAADGTGAFQYDDAGAVGLTKRFYRLAFP